MLKTILNRPVAVLTVFIVLVLVSVVLFLDIPLDMYPDISVPVLSVTMPFPGAGPEEVEEEVIRVVEGELSGLQGLNSLSSTASENYGVIVMEFAYGTDLDETLAEVRSRMDRVRPKMPAKVQEPVLQEYDAASLPIMTLTLGGDRSEKDLMRLARDKVVPSLESLAGVAAISVEGLRESVVQVEIEQSALEAYRLSLTSVAGILSAQNFQLGAGSFSESDKDILIRTSGRYESLEEIADTVIVSIPDASGQGLTPVKLRDMGRVSWGYADAEKLVRIDGEPGISMGVRKSSGANSVDVADSVKAALGQLNRELPAGVELSLLTDSTGEVRNNLFQLGSAAVLGIVFAIVVLLVFLRQLRSTIITGLSIPITLVVTVAGLSVSGRSLNLVTLVGLATGVGMVVDSSIVIIENIFRLRLKGAPLKVASFRGAVEMLQPIVASTLTTVAVFLPLIIFKNDLGLLGTLFGELAFVLILALSASLVVAVVLVPVLASRFLPVYTREERPLKSRFLRGLDQSVERGLERMEKGFGRFLGWCIRRKAVVVVVYLAVLAASLFLVRRLDVAMLPEIPQYSVVLKAEFPTGTAMTETAAVLEEIQGRLISDHLATDLSTEKVVLVAGKGEGSLEISLPDTVRKSAQAERIKEYLRAYFDDYPGIAFSFAGGIETEVLASPGVDVTLTGSDWEELLTSAEEVAQIVADIPGIAEVVNSSRKGLPQAEIVFDRRALYAQGLNAATVAAEVRALTAGITATTYIEDDETFDVVIRLDEEDRQDITDLGRMFTTNPVGERVSIAQVAEVVRTSGPASILRENQVRSIHVRGTLSGGASASQVTAAVRKALSGHWVAGPGVQWRVGGEMDDFRDIGGTMLLVMILAVLLVVAVMVAQFESVRDPFIIFLAMPLMVVGVAGLLALEKITLSLVAFMGIIMLAGIVVNNGIVLVDHARLIRKRGMGVVEAAVESGRNRLKPVLMTTLTTVLAMIPLAFFPGDGGRLMQPMALAVVGGLTASTAGTLVLVPVLYAMVHRKEETAE